MSNKLEVLRFVASRNTSCL